MQDKVNLIRFLYVNSPSIVSTSNTTFWWELHTQTEWSGQNKPFGSPGTELWESNIYIWVFFLESSTKFLQVTKNFASFSFCLCTPLLTLTQSFFSSNFLLKSSSSKTFVTRWNVSVMIAFPFLRNRFY